MNNTEVTLTPPSAVTASGRPAPASSVILCTIGRSAGLKRAMASVLAQRAVDFELIVVDNAPGSGNTVSVVQSFDDPRLRYVAEPRRGLSKARNLGSRVARGNVLAFTDDDCVVHADWLQAIRTVFDTHPEVSAVTGRTVPDGSPTPIQHLFEEFGSFNRGTERRVWHYPEAADAVTLPPSLVALAAPAESPAIFPYSAVFGSGNNMALRTSALERVGAFDEALGAGVPAGGGEDLDMFVRLMVAGLVLVYEPAAVVRHTHREDEQTLAAQVRSYGSGLSAMITKHLLLDRPSRIRIVRRVLPGLRHLFSARSAKNARKSAEFPRHLTRLELLGIASGPSRYLKGRRALLRDRPIDGATAATAADAATGVDERAVA